MDNQSNNDNTANDMMGYEQPATETPATQQKETPLDAQGLINQTIKELKTDDNGKYIYPEGIDPMLKAAIGASKSFRDTQSGYTKSQLSLKEQEAENSILREQLSEHTRKPLDLTPERQQELDDLMYTNPNEWRIEMNKLEQQSSIVANEALDNVTKEARQKASAEYQLQERVSILETYNYGRETPITPDVLDNDIPNRINNKLANGDVSFPEYLEEVSTYLAKGKVVAQSTPPNTADLNTANGGSNAQQSNNSNEGGINYGSTTF